MKVYLYSDGSKKNNKSSATTIILSETSFLGMIRTKMYNTSSSKAELTGLCQGLRYLSTKLAVLYNDPANEFIVRVDHEALVKIFERLKKNSDMKDLTCQSLWKEVMELTEGKNITLEYVRSHQEIFNPNKTCDIVSSMLT